MAQTGFFKAKLNIRPLFFEINHIKIDFCLKIKDIFLEFNFFKVEITFFRQSRRLFSMPMRNSIYFKIPQETAVEGQRRRKLPTPGFVASLKTSDYQPTSDSRYRDCLDPIVC